MIQKKLYWGNFLKMFQNGPIRKVITKKVIFEEFLIFSPAVGHPGLTLRKIMEDFFKKSQVRNSHYLFYKIPFYEKHNTPRRKIRLKKKDTF